MWGVASWAGKGKTGDSPWTEKEFYDLGESDWQVFLAQWKQYGFDKRSCLEIGCGAGRITKQLAVCFDRVRAVDVSEDIIGFAQREVRSENVEWSVIDGLHLPQGDGSVNSIFSAHVLQHLDSVEVGVSYFRELARVLEVGGTIMVHIPLYQFPNEAGTLGALMSSLYRSYRRIDSFRAKLKRWLGVEMMRGTHYPARQLSVSLGNLGFKKIEYRIFPVKSNGEFHSFVFATK